MGITILNKMTPWNKLSGLFCRGVSPHVVSLIVLLAFTVGTIEGLLFAGHTQVALVSYCALILALSLAPLVSTESSSIFQVFMIIPVFRLVNFSMPTFNELTLVWFPLIYGPFILTCLPWWFKEYRAGKLRALLRQGYQVFSLPEQEISPTASVLHWFTRLVGSLLFLFLAIALLIGMFLVTVYLAELEFRIADPSPLITTLDSQEVVLLAVVMIGFVGFTEELLFRGIVQQELESRLGIAPGLILTSCIFGAMHAAAPVPAALAFAAGIGLLFGILYDITGSLSLVSLMHGVLNAFVFGVIPLSGIGSMALLQALLGTVNGIVF